VYIKNFPKSTEEMVGSISLYKVKGKSSGKEILTFIKFIPAMLKPLKMYIYYYMIQKII
jgi:hypothetical protein